MVRGSVENEPVSGGVAAIDRRNVRQAYDELATSCYGNGIRILHGSVSQAKLIRQAYDKLATSLRQAPMETGLEGSVKLNTVVSLLWQR